MKIATTTADFGAYYSTDTDRIRALHRAGFRYIDLSMYALSPQSPLMQDNWREEVQRLRETAQELGMEFVQAHSPGGNFLSPKLADPSFLEHSILRSIQVCALLGIPHTVLHFGFASGLSKEQSFEQNRTFCQKFLPLMEETGVCLLMENSCQVNMGDKYYPNSAADLLEFLSFVGHPQLHICWDTGHANCEGHQYEQITALGKELYAIHYNDNHGTADEHLMPYLGTMSNDEVITALTDIGYQGCFTLECTATLLKKRGWPYKRRPFAQDERLIQPPLLLMEQMESTLYHTAVHLLSSYGLQEP